MRTLVAGSSGMIGSNIVRMIDRCIIWDLKNGVDLREPQRPPVEQFRIFDCAAPTRGIGSNDFLDTARIPMNLLAVKPEHYVYASSSCVYSDETVMPAKEIDGWFGEPEKANRGYGWAKRCGEMACKYSGVPSTICRLPNVYGPSYDWSKQHKHVIPSLIERMLHNEEPLVVWGSGQQTRSFLYESDAAKQMIELSRFEGTFNLKGEEASIHEVVEILADIIGYKARITYDKSMPTGPMRKALDTNKMERLIGTPLLTPLRTGLEITVAKAYDTLRNNRTLEPANRT